MSDSEEPKDESLSRSADAAKSNSRSADEHQAQEKKRLIGSVLIVMDKQRKRIVEDRRRENR